MPHFARVLLLALLPAASPLAQSPSAESRPYTFSLAFGPTRAFRGVDSPGIHGQGGFEYHFSQALGLRVEGTAHWYQQQPLYPCMVQDALRCYQTMRRAVSAGVLSGTYHLSRFAADEGRTVPYLITGIGVYKSRRIATHYPDCQPSGACADRATYELELRDTQIGWSGGAGLDFDIGSVPVFAELRLHYIYRDAPRGQPSNDYFLWPLSIGVRF